MIARLFAIFASVASSVVTCLLVVPLDMDLGDALIVATVVGVLCGKWIGGPRYSAPILDGDSEDVSDERFGKWRRLFYG